MELLCREFNSDDISQSEFKRNFLIRRRFTRKPKSLQSNWDENKANYFIDHDLLNTIFELYSDKITRFSALREHVLQFNENETIDFIKEILRHALCPKVVDLSKSLIFIIGNLDEAYKMAGDFNPDIDADSFYQETLKIGISEIKTALKRRFRKEQISRLGNTHIIYPSLDSNAFRNIIVRALNKIEEQWLGEFGATLNFDHSVIDILYAESVFPTQGARPVLSTINQLVRSRLGNIILEITKHKITGRYHIEWL